MPRRGVYYTWLTVQSKSGRPISSIKRESMKKLKSLSFLSAWLIFSLLFQIMTLPLVQAQQGIFIRDTGLTEDQGQSFRTVKDKDASGNRGGQSGSLGDLNTDKSMPMGASSLGQAGGSVSTLTGTGASTSALVYQVHILGEVFKPGIYRIPVSTRVSEALQVAGGIKNRGSERNIEIRHPGGGSKKVDLFSYKVFGQLQNNPYLVDNDVIFVPLKKKVVEIEGSVLRSGTYELRNEKTLADLIFLGGGYSQGAAKNEPLRVIRYDENEKKQVIEVENNPESLQEFVLEDGDVVVVSHLFTENRVFDYNLKKLPNDNIFYPSFEDRVFVLGSVIVPGAYNFAPQYKVSNYLALAGGMNPRLSKGYMEILSPDGIKKKIKPDSAILINPGDTIYVPEKMFTREGWIGLLTSMIGLGLSVTATSIALTR